MGAREHSGIVIRIGVSMSNLYLNGKKVVTNYTCRVLSLMMVLSWCFPTLAVTPPETSPSGDEQPQTASGAPQRMRVSPILVMS